MIDHAVLRKTFAYSPQQPATCIFRSAEITHLLSSGLLPIEGQGLDLGCGDGQVTRILRGHLNATWEVVGLDPDAKELELAKSLGGYRALLCSEGQMIDAPSASFDFVFSNSVLEHIPELDPVFTEVSRVLKTNGKFIFTVPSSEFHQCLAGPALSGWLATGETDRNRYREALDRRLNHLRYWDIGDWQRLLSVHGFSLEHSSEYLRPKELRLWETISNLTSGILFRLKGSVVRPIEIQRSLGVRRLVLPTWISFLATILQAWIQLRLRTLNVSSDSKNVRGACLLILGRKMSYAPLNQ